MAQKRVSGMSTSSNAWIQCTHVAEGHAGAALALAATHHLLFSGGVDRTVRGWDLSVGTEAWRGWCGGAVSALAAGEPDGRGEGRLLLAAAGGAVRLFDTRSRTPLTTLWSSGVSGPCPSTRGIAGEVAVTALALSHSHRLYTAAGDKLRLWDLRMLECICKVWSGHAAAVMCLALGSGTDGDLVVTGSKDHYVRTLEMQSQEGGGCEAGNRKLLEPPHYDGVQALALCDDVLYSASRDTSLKRWSLADNGLTHSVMNAHKGWVTGVCAVGAGGERGVVSCGRDAALRAWSPALRPAAPPAALPDAAHALAAHPRPAHRTVYTAGNVGPYVGKRCVAAAATCARGAWPASERRAGHLATGACGAGASASTGDQRRRRCRRGTRPPRAARDPPAPRAEPGGDATPHTHTHTHARMGDVISSFFCVKYDNAVWNISTQIRYREHVQKLRLFIKPFNQSYILMNLLFYVFK